MVCTAPCPPGCPNQERGDHGKRNAEANISVAPGVPSCASVVLPHNAVAGDADLPRLASLLLLSEMQRTRVGGKKGEEGKQDVDCSIDWALEQRALSKGSWTTTCSRALRHGREALHHADRHAPVIIVFDELVFFFFFFFRLHASSSRRASCARNGIDLE